MTTTSENTIYNGQTSQGSTLEVRLLTGGMYKGKCVVYVSGKEYTRGYPEAISEASRKGRHRNVPSNVTHELGKALLTADKGEPIYRAYLEATTPKIDGLEELRAAYKVWSDYNDKAAYLADQHKVCTDPMPQIDRDSLGKQYPAAALYLRAEEYLEASNAAKTAAGRKAIEILEANGPIGEASAVLDNWHNTSYVD